MKRGFTLSEVLITLGIIGVVAAMTIPTLNTNIRKKQFSIGLQKKHAELTQVLKMSIAINGNTNYWDYSTETDEFISTYIAPFLKISNCEDCWITATLPKGFWFEQGAYAAYVDPGSVTSTHTMTDEEQLNCYTEGSGSYCGTLIGSCQAGYILTDANGDYYLGGSNSGDSTGVSVFVTPNAREMCQAYLNGEYTAITPANEPEITYFLPDGSFLGFYKQNSKQVLFVYLDLNGKGNPNKFGIDRFLMMISANTLAFWGESNSDLTSGEYGCSTEGNGMYCGALLKRNHWNFDDNYPKL